MPVGRCAGVESTRNWALAAPNPPVATFVVVKTFSPRLTLVRELLICAVKMQGGLGKPGQGNVTAGAGPPEDSWFKRGSVLLAPVIRGGGVGKIFGNPVSSS